MLVLPDARRDQMVARVAAQLCRWNLREPALVFLGAHSPVAFLGSQLALAAEPFLGVFTGGAFARDFALVLQDPQTIEQLVTRLEQPDPAVPTPL